jgi:hypothetical protein
MIVVDASELIEEMTEESDWVWIEQILTLFVHPVPVVLSLPVHFLVTGFMTNARMPTSCALSADTISRTRAE